MHFSYYVWYIRTYQLTCNLPSHFVCNICILTVHIIFFENKALRRPVICITEYIDAVSVIYLIDTHVKRLHFNARYFLGV